MNYFSLDPIIDQNSKVLILGTMPGDLSFKKKQYYSNSRNKFWELLYNIYGETYYSISYENKIQFLKKNGIALWDMYSSCVREGSLDKDITYGKLNDLSGLLTEYNNVESLLFNGNKAYDLFTKNIDLKGLITKPLPSSSGAYAIKFEEKLSRWKKIFADAKVL